MTTIIRRTLVIGAAIAASALSLSAQMNNLAPDALSRYTALNPFDRFADGRPKVPDELVAEVRAMNLDIEEAWGLLREKGYPNQHEAGWHVLVPEKTLVGRAFTVQFMPTRADVADAMNKESEAKGGAASAIRPPSTCGRRMMSRWWISSARWRAGRSSGTSWRITCRRPLARA